MSGRYSDRRARVVCRRICGMCLRVSSFTFRAVDDGQRPQSAIGFSPMRCSGRDRGRSRPVEANEKPEAQWTAGTGSDRVGDHDGWT
jgi:hypothetical protein